VFVNEQFKKKIKTYKPDKQTFINKIIFGIRLDIRNGINETPQYV